MSNFSEFGRCFWSAASIAALVFSLALVKRGRVSPLGSSLERKNQSGDARRTPKRKNQSGDALPHSKARSENSGHLQHRHGAEQLADHVCDPFAFQLGLRPENEPMAEHTQRHGMDILVREIV